MKRVFASMIMKTKTQNEKRFKAKKMNYLIVAQKIQLAIMNRAFKQLTQIMRDKYE